MIDTVYNMFDEDFMKFDESAKLLELLTKSGIAVASINYRLAQEAAFPAAGVDVKTAIRFLRANASKYGYDPNKFATGGDSAGSYLALEAVGIFERGFTAGKGFTALAIMIFGRWNPLGAFAAAIFFGLAQAVTNQLMIDEVVQIPQQFINMLPYVLTIAILAISAGKVRPPAAEGIPYEKEKA